MTNIINCTPHDVNIIDKEGKVMKVFKPEPKPARCKRTAVFVDLEGIDVPIIIDRKIIKREIVDLPEPKEGVLYIVSKWVAEWAIGRTDLLVPDRVVREEGSKIGCKSLRFFRD